MIQDYIAHLEKQLEEANAMLKKTVSEMHYLKLSVDNLTEDKDKYYRYWMDDMGEKHKLQQQVKELTEQKKESEVTASNSFDNLKEAI